jgi:hypothetical protein
MQSLNPPLIVVFIYKLKLAIMLAAAADVAAAADDDDANGRGDANHCCRRH